MDKLGRKRKTRARVNERHFPFVVQVPVPDGGLGCTLDAINAWHYYGRKMQRQGQRQFIGDQEFRRWCFEGLEIAKAFRQRFGGQIMPVMLRRCPELRRNFAAQAGGLGQSACEATEQTTKDDR